MKETAEPQTGLILTEKSFVNLDKSGIKDFSMSVVDKFTDGYSSPTEGLIFAKKLTEAAELIKENLQSPAINEMKLGQGEKYSKFNCVITEQMVGVKYDFKGCGHKEYNKLIERVKEIEAFLKTVKGSMTIVDEDTGEVSTVYEPVKSGKLSPVIKVL
jgi:hypothetical protein